MTTSSATEQITKRGRGRKPKERITMRDYFLERAREARNARSEIRFPSPRYREDPVAFCREILGIKPWARQVEIIEAIRDHPRGAVSSGHKVSKSHTIASIALWYFSSYEDARVVCSSTTARQVDQIIWRELKMVRARGGRCLACKEADPDGRRIPRPCPHSALIDGEIGELARTGLKTVDFREIVGFTAREAEAVAGISGKNLLYLIDEASGVPQEIFEAIEGNRAGGARIWMFSNPTRNEGEFFDAFHSKKAFFHTIRVSSEETPNVVEGRLVIPGLATREWIEEKKQEWGEDSPLYKVRVRGEFALADEGRIFSVHAIGQAEERWHETPPSGRLFVGLDPAGESGSGDETVFAIRRGLKCLEIIAQRGLNEDQHITHLLALLDKHRNPRETPVVVFDREGSIGSALLGRLRSFLEQNPNTFELVAVRASDRASRRANVYDRMRDGLCANLEAWFRDGGAIPTDVKLSAELHSLEWKQAVNGRLKVTPKDTLRKALGRSPDRYDALALSVWEPLSLMEGEIPASVQAVIQKTEPHGKLVNYGAPVIDPYAGFGYSGPR